LFSKRFMGAESVSLALVAIAPLTPPLSPLRGRGQGREGTSRAGRCYSGFSTMSGSSALQPSTIAFDTSAIAITAG